jgi:hypothetical protein
VSNTFIPWLPLLGKMYFMLYFVFKFEFKQSENL